MTISIEPPPHAASPAREVVGERRGWMCPNGGFAAYWRPTTAIYVGLLLALLLAGRSAMLQDPGVFWHTVLGERLLETGEWTHEDAFTFTFAGKPWLDLQWLGGAAMATLWRISGWNALLLAGCVFLAVTYTWLANRMMREGFTAPAAVAMLLLVLAASSHHFHVRPHLASIFFLGLTCAWLMDVESRRSSVAKLWLIAPLFVLWTNIHGGVLAAWITFLLTAVGWTAARLLKLPGPLVGYRSWLTLAGVTIIAPLTFLVNPYGLAAPGAWVAIMRMPLPRVIQEHRPLDFTEPIALFVMALAVGYLALLRDAVTCRMKLAGPVPPRGAARLRSLATAARVTWLLPAVWLVLAVTRVRHTPLFAIVAALAIADMTPHSRFARWLEQSEFFRWPTNRSAAGRWNWRACVIPITLTLGILGLMAASERVRVAGHGWARLDPDHWPVELIDDLRGLPTSPEKPTRIFNDLNYGGFVTFHAPGLKTLIDDRCELFGAEFLSSYVSAAQHDPARLQRWAEQAHCEYALTQNGSPLCARLESSREWRVVRRARCATLFRRAHSRPHSPSGVRHSESGVYGKWGSPLGEWRLL